MSDHGFAPYRRKFSLNTWLYDNGYLVLKDGKSREELPADKGPTGRRRPRSSIWDGCGRLVAHPGLRDGLQRPVPEPGGARGDNPATEDDESGIVEPVRGARAPARAQGAKLEAVVDDATTGCGPSCAATSPRTIYAAGAVAEAPDMLVGLQRRLRQLGRGLAGPDPARAPHRQRAGQHGGHLTFNGNHLMAARGRAPASCSPTSPRPPTGATAWRTSRWRSCASTASRSPTHSRDIPSSK